MDDNKKLYDLKIDPEFKRLSYPLNKIKRLNLEKRIRDCGCDEGIRVWNSFIVIDFEKYELCHKYSKPFEIIKLPIKDRTEVLAFICEEMSKRTDVPKETIKYFVGKRYLCEKILGRHYAVTIKNSGKDRKTLSQTANKFDRSGAQTRERLSDEYHLSSATIFKYGLFTHKIDNLFSITPSFAQKIMEGYIKISHEQLTDLMKLPNEKLIEIEKNIIEEISEPKSFAEAREMLQEYIDMGRETKDIGIITPKIAIKEMPDYDPDLEFSSLALTIPSWIGSINRTKIKTSSSDVSVEKRILLEKELCKLKTTIDELISAIRGMN